MKRNLTPSFRETGEEWVNELLQCSDIERMPFHELIATEYWLLESCTANAQIYNTSIHTKSPLRCDYKAKGSHGNQNRKETFCYLYSMLILFRFDYLKARDIS